MIKDANSPPWRFIADVTCRCSGSEITLVVDGVPIARQRGNKWRCGHYVGKHDIVKLLTRFHDTNYAPPSPEVIGLMEGAIELLGDIFDSMLESVQDEVERRLDLARSANRYSSSYENVDRDLRIELGETVVDDLCESRYLYLFRHQNGLTKIGYSKDPHRREKTIQAEDPRIHMLATRPGTSDQERRLHKIFAEKRVRGEWFDLNENDVDRLFWICGFNHAEGYCNG